MIEALLGVFGTLLTELVFLLRIYFNYRRTLHEIDILKHENTVIMRGLLASLDGLHQLGANSTVTEAAERLQSVIYKRGEEVDWD